jgi:large subunit ribosomal protein L2
MEIIKSKPNTNGVRHKISTKKSVLSKTNIFFKQSILGFKQFVGRSSLNGRITTRHKGSGCKKKFRVINFSNLSKSSLVISIIYDPFRNSLTTLSFDLENLSFFRGLSTNHVGPGSTQICGGHNIKLKLGNRTLLKNIPTGSILHSLSAKNSFCKYSRSAGSFFQIIQKGLKTCKIRLPSGFVKEVSANFFSTIGSVSNSQYNSISIGKAGRNRLMGVRPSVRGVAMNPVDHPHGGRTNGGKCPVTPWGVPTKGKPTVLRKKK